MHPAQNQGYLPGRLPDQELYDPGNQIYVLRQTIIQESKIARTQVLTLEQKKKVYICMIDL